MSAHLASLPFIPSSTSFEPRRLGFRAFIRECWRRMTVMHADFESSESGHGVSLANGVQSDSATTRHGHGPSEDNGFPHEHARSV